MSPLMEKPTRCAALRDFQTSAPANPYSLVKQPVELALRAAGSVLPVESEYNPVRKIVKR